MLLLMEFLLLILSLSTAHYHSGAAAANFIKTPRIGVCVSVYVTTSAEVVQQHLSVELRRENTKNSEARRFVNYSQDKQRLPERE